jgi:hypothetical protein
VQGLFVSSWRREPATRPSGRECSTVLKRIAGSGENDHRRFLPAERLEAYAELDEAQNERLQTLSQ